MLIHAVDLQALFGVSPSYASVIKLLKEFPGCKIVTSEDETFSGDLHYTFEIQGFGLIFDEGNFLCTIFLFSEDYHSGYGQFRGKCPFDLDFDCTRAQVRERLGMPTYSNDKGKVVWDRYDLPEIVIHYQFWNDDPGIDLITLMMPGTEPDLTD